MLQINDALLYKYQTFLFNFNAFKEFKGKLDRFYFLQMKINVTISPKWYFENLYSNTFIKSLLTISKTSNIFAIWNIKEHLHSFVS